MRQYKVTLNGKEHLVNLISKNGGAVEFEVNGQRYSTSIAPNIDLTTNSSHGSSAKATPSTGFNGEIKAPMPGIIVSINVQEGANVSVGDNILVIEAMKMENNITAPKAGVIKKIHTKVGSEVQNGQLLVSIE